jgi:two-component system chemotaxis response regulator CheY
MPAAGQDMETAAMLVLIADDEVPIVQLVAEVVADAGHTSVVATHGQRALELARERRPALVITDLMMPRLTGAEFIRALHTDAAASHREPVPVIVMTAGGSGQALGVGADAVLRKPFDIVQLEALLTRFLGSPTSTRR